MDAIAEAVFSSSEMRNWMIQGTPMQEKYADSDILSPSNDATLLKRQEDMRKRQEKTGKRPEDGLQFYENYWCGRDKKCTCHPEGSTAVESDAIFFFKNDAGRILAVHVEFKHENEKFKYGQAESYPHRAACFVETWRERTNMNEHHDWATVLICGAEKLKDSDSSHFQRVITHGELRERIPNYPSA